MIAALVIVSLVSLALSGLSAFLAYKVPALAAKALATGEELLKAERVTDEATARATDLQARLTFAQAEAAEATDHLAQTQRLYAAATARLVALKQTQLLGATNEEVLDALHAELAEELSKQPGTALEKPE